MKQTSYITGKITPQTAWDALSISEKAEMMKVAVRNGITSLQEIRQKYNEFKEGGEITYGKPYYSYNKSGKKVEGVVNYNGNIPEIVVIPDSQLSPKDRNYKERQRQRTFADYDAQRDREWTATQSLKAHREWENSPQKKALDYGIAAAQGIGMGADIVSTALGGLPVYSGLKGALALDRAVSSGDVMDYVDAGLWLSPMLTVGGKQVYNVAKPAVQKVFQKGTPAAEWAEAGRIPNITLENTASMTDAQWDVAYNAAVNAGDMAEAQRLRELHFKAKAPNANLPEQFHGSFAELGNSIKFDSPTILGGKGRGAFYTSSVPEYAHGYGPLNKFYVNANSYELMPPLQINGIQIPTTYLPKKVRDEIISKGYKGTKWSFVDFDLGRPVDEITVFDPKMYKSANVITRDDAGNIIPLSQRDNFGVNDIRFDFSNANDAIIESRISATPNVPYDEAWFAASKGRHQMSNLVGSDEYAGRVRQAYQENGIPVNQADFEIRQAEQGIKDSNLKVVPNLKNAKGETLNGQYDPNSGDILVSQDRDNILDVVGTSGHEHAHASEVEKLIDMLKEKWKHIKPRREAVLKADGTEDAEWKEYISRITEMRAPAMSVWSEMKELGFNKVGDYINHLKRFGLEDKQWEALVDRYGLTNAKYMVETVFGISPLILINNNQNEEENSPAL